jgi:hypothetical protein
VLSVETVVPSTHTPICVELSYQPAASLLMIVCTLLSVSGFTRTLYEKALLPIDVHVSKNQPLSHPRVLSKVPLAIQSPLADQSFLSDVL